ncbi:hypothetical protein CYL16_04765 [Mycobacterium sp. EPG1]|nr:hypothetical protein CYL16_04765 [Mycobacterium sp. EPG1]
MVLVGCFDVRLAYIDETYTEDEFWIVSLVVPEAAAKPIERAMDTIVAAANRSFPEIDPSTELHGYALDDGSEGWEPLKSKPQARVNIYRSVINALCEIDGLMMFRSCINLKLLSWGDGNDPHDWALKLLFEKIDREFLHKELVLAICDDVGQRERYREAFRRFKIDGTGGYQPRRLEAFVDALHFVPSHHSRLIQATDMAAYAFRRAVVAPPSNAKSRKVYADLWEQMYKSDVMQHRWRVWPLA